MTIPFSAGGLYSTAPDLLRWEQALYGGKLLSAVSLARMTRPFKRDYAFGLAVDPDTRGNKVIWHCGLIEGFAGCISYVPAEKLSLVILSNVEGKVARTLMVNLLTILGHEPLMPK